MKEKRVIMANFGRKFVPNLYSSTTQIRLFALLVTAIFTLILLAPLTTAQNTSDGSFNLVVSPLPAAIEAKPGMTVTTDLKLKNAGSATEKIKIDLMKFGAEGEDGTPKLLDIEPADEFIKWVTFSENKFEAEPNVWKNIKMNIAVPADAAYGYYYAVVFSRDNVQPQPQKANLLGAVASLVLLNVDAPGAKREAKLTEFSMPKKMYEFLPTEFTIRMQNSGNVHVAPRGNIFIYKGGDNQGMLEVNQNKGFILPDAFRKFDAKWEDGSPVYRIKTADGKVSLDKNGKQQSYLDWDSFKLSKLRMGKYTANITMVYNDGKYDVPVQGTVSFWVIPWRIIGVLLLIVILVLGGLYTLVVRPIRGRLKKV